MYEKYVIVGTPLINGTLNIQCLVLIEFSYFLKYVIKEWYNRVSKINATDKN